MTEIQPKTSGHKRRGWRRILNLFGAKLAIGESIPQTQQPLPSIKDEPLPVNPEANDVFCPGGTPTFTLIDRSGVPGIANIIFNLRRRATIISLYGESKSGKTILCLQVLKDRRPIEVHAREAKSAASFWDALVQRLNLPVKIRRQDGEHHEVSGGGEVAGTVEVNGMIIGKATAAARVHGEAKHEKEAIEIKEFTPNGKIVLTDELVRTGRPIVIDDFHWLDPTVQVEILRDLRRFIDRNGSVIVISVPERAEQILSQDMEMKKLCISVKSPDWDIEQIVRIGREGFKTLNVDIDDKTVRRLANYSHSNPMLMQENCLQVCARKGIFQKQEPRKSIKLDVHDLSAILTETAMQRSQEIFRQFTGGDSPKTWVTVRGHKVDIYTLLLLAMRRIRFHQEIGRDRLGERIAEIIGPKGKVPDKATITKSLISLSNQMKEKLGDNTPIEYDQRTGRVYFLDPFFMAYIQWVLAPSVGEPTPLDIINE